MSQEMAIRVAIVGGGASGLAACRCMLEAGHQPVVFEQHQKQIGGIWIGDDATRPVLYKGLVTNLPHQVMQFHDFPFPKELPSYVKGKDVQEYLEAYTAKYELWRHIRLGCDVQEVKRIGEKDWEVKWKEGLNHRSERFAAVVVANGHYRVPYTPDVKGIATWMEKSVGSTISHAAEYRVPDPFKDRTVLVIGAKSSGVDLAREISEFAKCVYIVDLACERIAQRRNRIHLPGRNFSITPQGLPYVGGVPVQGPPITDVIFATGYQYSFPFLDLEAYGMRLGPQAKCVEGLALHMVCRKYPTELFFVGLPLVVAPFPLVEPQGRFCAAVLTGAADMSSSSKSSSQRPQDTHVLAEGQWNYVKDLLRRAHIANYTRAARRVDTVEQLYNDRVSRLPSFPGDPDSYRFTDYAVDWNTGEWSVADPKL